jgi:hypothetical protein
LRPSSFSHPEAAALLDGGLVWQSRASRRL